MSLLLARTRLCSESQSLPLRGASLPAAEVSAALTFADFTAIAVLAAVVLWVFRSEPPRVLLRALRQQARQRPMNVEDM
jgi:hypothetical protein